MHKYWSEKLIQKFYTWKDFVYNVKNTQSYNSLEETHVSKQEGLASTLCDLYLNLKDQFILFRLFSTWKDEWMGLKKDRAVMESSNVTQVHIEDEDNNKNRISDIAMQVRFIF